MKITLYLNKTYKHSCNLISIDINCKNFNLLSYKDNTKILLIDNIGVYTNFINSIDFFVNNYKNTIEVNNNGNICSTNLEYKEKIIINDVENLNNFLLNLK